MKRVELNVEKLVDMFNDNCIDFGDIGLTKYLEMKMLDEEDLFFKIEGIVLNKIEIIEFIKKDKGSKGHSLNTMMRKLKVLEDNGIIECYDDPKSLKSKVYRMSPSLMLNTENIKSVEDVMSEILSLNSISTNNEALFNMLWDKDDGYIYSETSLEKVHWKCSQCGSKTEEKSISYVKNFGAKCDKCSDSLSYPEKVMKFILEHTGLKFEREKSFKWSQRKRYDFYILSLNMLLETHGNQHYVGSFEYLGGRTLEEEIANDKLKRELALLNGIENYIELDCRVSKFDYIKDSLLNSDFKVYIENLDFEYLKDKFYSEIIYNYYDENKYYHVKDEKTLNLIESLSNFKLIKVKSSKENLYVVEITEKFNSFMSKIEEIKKEFN